MDKRKYKTKTLIAEHRIYTNSEDFRLSESAYRLKDGRIIMEYDGGRLSRYGVAIDVNNRIGRKGICSVSEEDYEMWKRIIRNDKGGVIDWEKEKQEQFEEWQNEMFKVCNDEHEEVLKLVNIDDLPF